LKLVPVGLIVRSIIGQPYKYLLMMYMHPSVL